MVNCFFDWSRNPPVSSFVYSYECFVFANAHIIANLRNIFCKFFYFFLPFKLPKSRKYIKTNVLFQNNLTVTTQCTKYNNPMLMNCTINWLIYVIIDISYFGGIIKSHLYFMEMHVRHCIVACNKFYWLVWPYCWHVFFCYVCHFLKHFFVISQKSQHSGSDFKSTITTKLNLHFVFFFTQF